MNATANLASFSRYAFPARTAVGHRDTLPPKEEKTVDEKTRTEIRRLRPVKKTFLQVRSVHAAASPPIRRLAHCPRPPHIPAGDRVRKRTVSAVSPQVLRNSLPACRGPCRPCQSLWRP